MLKFSETPKLNENIVHCANTETGQVYPKISQKIKKPNLRSRSTRCTCVRGIFQFILFFFVLLWRHQRNLRTIPRKFERSQKCIHNNWLKELKSKLIVTDSASIEAVSEEGDLCTVSKDISAENNHHSADLFTPINPKCFTGPQPVTEHAWWPWLALFSIVLRFMTKQTHKFAIETDSFSSEIIHHVHTLSGNENYISYFHNHVRRSFHYTTSYGSMHMSFDNHQPEIQPEVIF